jgi:hypothetical protein
MRPVSNASFRNAAILNMSLRAPQGRSNLLSRHEEIASSLALLAMTPQIENCCPERGTGQPRAGDNALDGAQTGRGRVAQSLQFGSNLGLDFRGDEWCLVQPRIICQLI